MSAPLWAVFAVQGASVVGDALGQRASRKDFHGSTRRMLLGLSAVSAVQVRTCTRPTAAGS